MAPMNVGIVRVIASTNPPTTTQKQDIGPIFSTMSGNHTIGSLANTLESLAVFCQQIDESRHDLASLLTQQMANVLNPLIATNNARFEQLARQVGRIAEVINLDESPQEPNDAYMANASNLENPKNLEANMRMV